MFRKYNLLYVIYVVTLILSFTTLAQSNKSLLAVLDLDDYSLSPVLLLKLERQFTHQLSQPVKIKKLLAPHRADLVISLKKDAYAAFQDRIYEVGHIPEFSRVSLATPLVQDLVPAYVRRPFMVSYKPTSYTVEESETARKLLVTGKISSIIDYADNEASYLTEGTQLTIEPISPRLTLFLHFKSRQLLKTYSSSSTMTNDITRVEKANYSNTVKWFMPAKKFDENIKKRIAAPEDIYATQLLQSRITDTHLEYSAASSMTAFEKMRLEPNICMFNTKISEKRQEVAHFSVPTYIYLNQRIYVKKHAQFRKKLDFLSQQNNVDLPHFLKTNKTLTMGYYRRYGKTFSKSLANYIAEEKSRVIDLSHQDITKDKILSLLKKDRIQLLVDYPATFQAKLASPQEADEYASYLIKDMTLIIPSYLACSKTPIGKNVIDQVNSLINDNELRMDYLDIYQHGMTKSSKSDFVASFEQFRLQQ